MEDIPNEIKHKIGLDLSVEDLNSIACVDNDFVNIMNDENFWRNKVIKKFGHRDKITKIKSWRDTYNIMDIFLYVLNIKRWDGDFECYGIYSNEMLAIKNIFKFYMSQTWRIDIEPDVVISNIDELMKVNNDFNLDYIDDFDRYNDLVNDCVRALKFNHDEEGKLISLFKEYRFGRYYDSRLVKLFKSDSVGKKYYKYLKYKLYDKYLDYYQEEDIYPTYRSENFSIELKIRSVNTTFYPI